jgi:hypothetical protein
VLIGALTSAINYSAHGFYEAQMVVNALSIILLFVQGSCPGEPPIGGGFDAWLATTRCVAGCRTDSTRERTQAGTAASRSS